MIIEFLKTKADKNELKSALKIIKEFKKNESTEEWAIVPFIAWSKLEQLEEYLEYLVNNKELAKDTLEFIKINKIKL